MRRYWMSAEEFFTIIFGLAMCLSYNFTNARKDFLKETNWRPAVKLENILPEGYDSMQAPRVDGRPTNVSVRIVILNIRSVDVSEMSYVADIFLYKRWSDERLQFPDSSPEDKIAMNVEWRQHIWTPDIFFQNAIEGHIHQTIIPCMYLWLHNDRTVFFAARLSLEFSCDMNLKAFPHDTQECDIIVMSLTHTTSQMDLKWEQDNDEGLAVGDLIVLPQFEIGHLGTGECKREYRIGTFSCLRGVIKLNRRVGYYIINIYIPTILIVFMSMLTFWIPPEAVPARITLGVTSLLTIVTKQYQASLPSVSYVIAMNIWLSCCIAFVFCSLMEYAVVIAMVSKNTRLAAARASARNDRGDEENKGSRGKEIDPVVPIFDPTKIDQVSRIVFPVLFVAQAILYWIVYAPGK